MVKEGGVLVRDDQGEEGMNGEVVQTIHHGTQGQSWCKFFGSTLQNGPQSPVALEQLATTAASTRAGDAITISGHSHAACGS